MAERVWLVEREYTDKGLVTIVYATPDGERKLVEQRSSARLGGVTAAQEVEPDRLSASDPDEVDRYADEAARMADRHEPDDEV